MADQKQPGITAKKSEDFSEWYTQLLQEAELADIRYNLKGFVVYRPWSVRSMEKMFQKMESILQSKGHEPVVMPTLIPEKNFKMESSHIAGFTPEVFWVTEHGNGEKFEEKMALRPTSETAFYQMYSLWIQSYKDLPFKGYQKGSVFRCEGKATRPFFRAREFHWIETHCAHANSDEALKQVIEDMETTKEFLLDELCLPFVFFERPEWDKFAGADRTFAADVLMPSGKVLQLPSTHILSIGFSTAFNVKYKDENEKDQFVRLTCYGPAISRIYGAMICFHGDDKGLVLPFDYAPVQVVIVPILFKDSKEKVIAKAEEIKNKLSGYIVKTDSKEDISPGWKYNQWEMKGVPIRIEIGPKDMEKNSVVISRRDTGQKSVVNEKDILDEVNNIRKDYMEQMKKRAIDKSNDEIVSSSPGSPNMWSPCQCDMHIFDVFAKLIPQIFICLCVPSAQSNRIPSPLKSR